MTSAQALDLPATPTADAAVFAPYAQLCRAILGDISGACLLDGTLAGLGELGSLRAAAAARAARRLGWGGGEAGPRESTTVRQGVQYWLTLLPVESGGTLLGVLAVLQPSIRSAAPPEGFAGRLFKTLKPLLECLRRELQGRRPQGEESIRSLTERAAELEWLLAITGNLRGAADDRQVIEELLAAAAARLGGAFGVLFVPEKHLCVEQVCDADHAAEMRAAWERTRSHLLVWAQRQRRPLIVDGVRRAVPGVPPCKILCVPVARDRGRVTGVLAFFNPPGAAGFRKRQIFLAQHLGRQSAGFIDAQFDAMTGLYTREGLEHRHARLPGESGGAGGSLLYVDVDGMRDVNELHGFEVGNELIVRVADVLAPPELPEQALAARLAGDKFAIALPGTDTGEAEALARRIQAVIERLAIGPVDDPIEFSVSCGVAALVPMAQGLARALATAEVACKTAKKRGRGRTEVYSCDDRSMLRCHQDAVAVGQLRAALRADRLLLYAQRIAPLRNAQLPGGYEILLRLLDPQGGIVLPSSLLQAAQRYQLLPTIDRWVMRRALQVLSPYRSMLKSRGLTLSINLSGQSIGDEEFFRQLSEALQAAGLPPGSVTFEITEQAAVDNLARAGELIGRLTAWKCCFALDDFGTGSNSLTYLKALPITRVKIDGSFVRDILTNVRSQATVRGIVELARGMSLDTVAEYVESEAIAGRMRELGVDYGQGYAFGKPQPLEAVLEELSREESRRLHRLFLET